MHALAGDIASVRQTSREMEQDIRALEDVKSIKDWLKKIRREMSRDDFDACPF